jgi:hypothetical protein
VLQPPPRLQGAHALILANSRWHPAREQLRELYLARVERAHVQHAANLTSMRRILPQLDPTLIWWQERPTPARLVRHLKVCGRNERVHAHARAVVTDGTGTILADFNAYHDHGSDA